MNFFRDVGISLLGGWIIGVVFGFFKLPAPVPPLMGLIGAGESYLVGIFIHE